MKLLVIFFFCYASHVYAWGPLGHRITAQIASDYLDKDIAIKVNNILKNESMPMVSVFPDFIKSDPKMRKEYSSYHYLSFPKDKTLKQGKSAQNKNILNGIEYFSKVLKDKKASKDNKKFALSFIIHLIGDLHQPLHVGYNHDHGGNKVKLDWFGEKSNLHEIWDSRLIRLSELSFSEYAKELKRMIKPKELIVWTDNLDINLWASESRNYLKQVYDFKEKKYWEFNYSYKHRFFLDQRLKQGGVRLAAYLNKLLK